MQIPWDLVHNRIAVLEENLAKLQGKDRVLAQKEHARLVKLVLLQKEVEDFKFQIIKNNQALDQLQLGILQDKDVSKKEHSSTHEVQELISLYKTEQEDLEALCNRKINELEQAIIPADPDDEQSVFIEIRAGTGGQEAALFAADLAGMYTSYALKKGWRISVVDESRTDLQGVREIVLHIQGQGVYGHLKFEAGVHRVQRVPKTETQGRVHTSTATVAVLPEMNDEVEFVINPSDLRIDVYRASGAGGQHVNTTDSAVRITHIPTGVVVACQDERSQHKNKAKALKILQSRIVAHEKEKHDAELGQKRKEMIGRAMRSEKVRTYNFPQNRVTDHTIDLTLKKLDYIIEGDLDDLIMPLIEHEKEERKKEAFIF